MINWLLLAFVCVFMSPTTLLVALALSAAGSRPLLTERETFDSNGVPVRYQVFSLQFSPEASRDWLTSFLTRHFLNLLPSLFSGLRGWLPPEAVWRLWQPVWERGAGHRT